MTSVTIPSWQIFKVLFNVFLFGSILSISQRYVFVDNLVIDNEAEACCQRLYGTSLASIHSSSDNLEAQTLCVPQPTDERQSCQIGLNDYVNEAFTDGSNFVWTDGTALDYQNWETDEPNDYYRGIEVEEDWVTIEKSTGGWRDEMDGRSFRFLCNFGTKNPTATCEPTPMPSAAPSRMPSSAPTSMPSVAPSRMPSAAPSAPTSMPSVAPSRMASSAPSDDPTQAPSVYPSYAPTEHASSIAPSVYPTIEPSMIPTHVPTRHATIIPNTQPSTQLVVHLPGTEVSEVIETTYYSTVATLVDDITKNEREPMNLKLLILVLGAMIAIVVVFISCFICFLLYRSYWKQRNNRKVFGAATVRIASVSSKHMHDDNTMVQSNMMFNAEAPASKERVEKTIIVDDDDDIDIIDKMIEQTPAYGDDDDDDNDDMEMMEEIVATVNDGEVDMEMMKDVMMTVNSIEAGEIDDDKQMKTPL